MPPRFAYWTILIDGKPTAFRARDQQELLPTFHQLKRTNADIVFRWFARGRLWESQQQERDAQRQRKQPSPRGPDWRPGGQHKDPRARFAKKSARQQGERARDRHKGPARSDVKKKPAGARVAFGRRARKRQSRDEDE